MAPQKLDEQYKGNLDLLQVARCTKVEQLRNFYPLVWEGREIESQINAAKKNETTTTDNAPSTVSKRKKRSESLHQFHILCLLNIPLNS